MSQGGLICADIGNSRVKLGHFSLPLATSSPSPTSTLTLGEDWQADQLAAWCDTLPGAATWRIASVNRSGFARLEAWVREHHPSAAWEVLTYRELELRIELAEPERVGMDRLVNAIAANLLRATTEPAIVIDVGSAITVDLVTAEGAFAGGAIFPGLGMSARAMHQSTDLLPLIPYSELASPPPPLGTSTVEAMRSGLYWGALGAIRELIARLVTSGPAPSVWLTGGASASFAELLAEPGRPRPQYVAQLTLIGIALAKKTAASAGRGAISE